MTARKEELIDNIILWITEDCNLRCRYCFVRKNKRTISKETIQKLFEFMRSNRRLFHQRAIINFTGGEPFLKFDIIKYIVECYKTGRGEFPINLDFAVITNGTLLNDKIIDFLARNRFQVMYSIDGTPSTNNDQRPYEDGASSYRDDIKELVSKMKREQIPLTARLTFSQHHLNLTENVKHLVELGFSKIEILHDMEEKWNGEKTKEEKKPSPDSRLLKSALYDLARYYIKEVSRGNHIDINIFNEYLARYILAKSNDRLRPTKPCESGKSVVGITIDGEIYPCHHWHNQSNITPDKFDYKKCRLGTLEQGIDPQKRREFIDFSSDHIEKCRKCGARFICGGPCYAVSYLYYGDIYRSFKGQCIYMKALIPAIKYVFTVFTTKYPGVLGKIIGNLTPNKSSSCCD